jgi:fatty acid synthase subunit beta
MVSGRKIIKIEVSNKETEDKVLLGEAEVEQPTTSYVFTGQGSQEQGMGMDLYNSSPVAKEVWDRADKHFMDNYGTSVSLVRRNHANSCRFCYYKHCEDQPQGAYHPLWRTTCL